MAQFSPFLPFFLPQSLLFVCYTKQQQQQHHTMCRHNGVDYNRLSRSNNSPGRRSKYLKKHVHPTHPSLYTTPTLFPFTSLSLRYFSLLFIYFLFYISSPIAEKVERGEKEKKESRRLHTHWAFMLICRFSLTRDAREVRCVAAGT